MIGFGPHDSAMRLGIITPISRMGKLRLRGNVVEAEFEAENGDAFTSLTLRLVPSPCHYTGHKAGLGE